MARLRYNNSLGTIADNPLTSGATTINFNAAPTWATITGSDYIPLVLEPPSAASPSANFEVVWVTAYTSGATSATILRAQEGTSAVSHAQNAVWMVAPTRVDNAQRVELVLGARGLITEPFPVIFATTGQAPSTTRIFAMPIGLIEGETVTNINAVLKVAAVGTAPTSAIFALTRVSTNLVVAQTANVNADAQWNNAANTPMTFALSSPYVVPASDAYWISAYVLGTWGTTQPTLGGGGAASSQGVQFGSGARAVATVTNPTGFPANGSSIGALTGPTNAVAIWLAPS